MTRPLLRALAIAEGLVVALLVVIAIPSDPYRGQGDVMGKALANMFAPAAWMLAIVTAVVAVTAWRENPRWLKWQLGGVGAWLLILVVWFFGNYRGP